MVDEVVAPPVTTETTLVTTRIRMVDETLSLIETNPLIYAVTPTPSQPFPLPDPFSITFSLYHPCVFRLLVLPLTFSMSLLRKLQWRSTSRSTRPASPSLLSHPSLLPLAPPNPPNVTHPFPFFLS